MSVSKSNGQPTEAEADVGNIFLFIPNLIGIAHPLASMLACRP
jgi:hypothetical protein